MTNAIRLVDPLSLRAWDVPPADYFKRPFQTVCERSHLTEYMVLNVEVYDDQSASATFRHHLPGRGKLAVGDVEVARMVGWSTLAKLAQCPQRPFSSLGHKSTGTYLN